MPHVLRTCGYRRPHLPTRRPSPCAVVHRAASDPLAAVDAGTSLA